MRYEFPLDLQRLIAERLATGACRSEDDVLGETFQALAEQEDDLAAVQQAIDELKDGDAGIPLGEAVDAIRSRHRLSRDS